MKIEIKQENYKQLIQCIYLGNLIFNEYRKGESVQNEYSDFLDNVLLQVVRGMPKTSSKLRLNNITYEKTEDIMLADLIDKIEDSVKESYESYRFALFAEMLADRIADRNYPVFGNSETDSFNNLIAKNLYYELIMSGRDDCIHIDAPKICHKLRMEKGNYNESFNKRNLKKF